MYNSVGKSSVLLLLWGALIFSFISCNPPRDVEEPEEIIGAKPNELKIYFDLIKEKAGIENAELLDLKSYFIYADPDVPGSRNSANLSVTMVNPENKNQLLEYRWEKGNIYMQPVILSIDDEEASEYDEFQYALFPEADIEKVLEKMDEMIRKSIDESEFGDNGYVQFYYIELDEFRLYQHLKVSTTVKSKTDDTEVRHYNFDTDGKIIRR